MAGTVALASELTRPIKILEIGSWIGTSALTWATAIDEFIREKGALICVDPWLPYVSRNDIESELGETVYTPMNDVADLGLAYECFLHNIEYAPSGVQIDHFRGTSNRVLPYLQEKSFDIVYIDGAHYYENVLFDIKEADRLLRDGGIVCGDDLEQQYHEVEAEHANALMATDFTNDPKTGHGYHPGVTVAVHEVFGEVSAYYGYWLMKKTSNGYEQMTMHSKTTFPCYMPQEERDLWRRELGL